jgi:hypothetical protein
MGPSGYSDFNQWATRTKLGLTKKSVLIPEAWAAVLPLTDNALPAELVQGSDSTPRLSGGLREHRLDSVGVGDTGADR